MKESQFRSKLIAEFNAGQNPRAFIWAHDAHFRAGFPDLDWVAAGVSGRAELKVCKGKLPSYPFESLCTKIQQHVMLRLARAGAKVHLIVLVERDGLESEVYVMELRPLAPNLATLIPYRTFMNRWREVSTTGILR